MSSLASTAQARTVVVAATVFALLTGAGASSGGYFPGAWGWLTLLAAWLAAIALVLDRPFAVSRTGAATLGLLAAFAGWTLLSTLWSVDVTQSALEAQRTLVYVVGFGLMLLLARRSAGALAGGAWAAIVALCSYGLATKLVPDRFGLVDVVASNRLAEPLGYWNALGLFAAFGVILALGFVAESRALGVRAAAGASLPLLAVTIFFTSSRGAWGSLLAGLAIWLVVDRRRLHSLAAMGAAAPWAAVGVGTAWRLHTLTSGNPPPLSVQAHDGHRLVLLLLALMVCGGAAAVALALLERRLALGAATQRRILLGLGVVAVALALGGFAVAGSPWSLARHGWDRFTAPQPISTTTPSVSGHLLELSGSGRIDKWRVAWSHEVVSHPLLGTGAGTFGRYWDRYRPTAVGARNAHSLYLETLATLGPIGLVLLLGLVAVPFWAGVRARSRPLVPALLAVWTAFVLHAAIDWDWQIAAVTLTALASAAALLATDGGVLSARVRVVSLAAAVVAGGLGAYEIAMQHSLATISSSANPAAAARSAADLQPWSTEPWQRLAETDIGSGNLTGARAALAKALAKDPSDWSLWLDRAKATAGIPRIDALHRADRLNPRSSEIAAFRATMLSLSQLSQGAKP